MKVKVSLGTQSNQSLHPLYAFWSMNKPQLREAFMRIEDNGWYIDRGDIANTYTIFANKDEIIKKDINESDVMALGERILKLKAWI